MKKHLLQIPTYDDFVRLLMAWRVYALGAVLGALAAAVVFYLLPYQYRAEATVLVDQNAEQMIPEERSDLRIYTYLQRETDKLVEIAWSDQVLGQVAVQTGVPVAELRDGTLTLSQPSDGGWHFIADAADPASAAAAASAWAQAFYDAVAAHPEGISSLIEINPVEVQDLVARPVRSPGVFLFGGSLIGVVVVAFGLLFVGRKGK